jgi:dethiobiotin synthetase
VEGAGGLLVPLTGSATIADLVARLEIPLLVVARTRLGTINHTLLTVEVARARGLRVAGVVFSRDEPVQGPEEGETVATIAAHGAVRTWGVLPFSARPLDEAGSLVERHLQLDQLLEQTR